MPIIAPNTGETIMQRIEALARISESPLGLTRRFATEEHKRANALVAEWMEAAGMQVREDAIGNIIGRYEGASPNAKAIMLGSHLDTVVMAGRYDGMLGVLCGISCVEYLSAKQMHLPCAIEVIGFADEEGVRYQSTFLGSRVVTGNFDVSLLDRSDKDGITMRDALAAFDKNPDDLAAAKRQDKEIAAYLEVHIEQGPVLEQYGLGVGLVTGIAGATRMVVTIEGEAGHAGTVPMNLRRDALAAAAACITVVENECSDESDLVGTVGRIEASPGAGNVIPGRCEFTIDVRAGDDTRRKAALASITSQLSQICNDRQVQLGIEEVHNANSVACDTRLCELISDAISDCELPVCQLTSGAGHDAMEMANIAPMGMIFVRCAEGISHNPAESITESDAALGADVLLRTVLHFSDS